MISGKYLPTVLSTENRSNGDRGFLTVPLANSTKHFVGEFFDPFTGANGAQAFAANQKVRGVVVDIESYVNGQYISVFDAQAKGLTLPGTFHAQTSILNAAYTAPSNNVTRTYPDRLVYKAINVNDSVEVFLGAAGVAVARGTTANSNVLNCFLEPDPTYPWMLIESGVSAVATGLCFQIVGRPTNRFQVRVRLINADGSVS